MAYNKGFRCDESIIQKIEEIKSNYKKQGLELTDSDIIRMCVNACYTNVRELWQNGEK